MAILGLDRWQRVTKGARAVERLRSWGETGAIFRVKAADGRTKHYILFGLGGDPDPSSPPD
jgi:hypothetical protein